MSSPDLTPYIDVKIMDLDPQRVFVEMLDYARTALPDYEPRVGDPSWVLMQAFALATARQVASVNRLPNALTEIMLRLAGVERQGGTRAQTVIRVDGLSGATGVLEKGTRFTLYPSGATQVLVLELDDDLTVSSFGPGSSRGFQAATATVATSEFNGIPAGERVALASAVPWVASAELTEPITGGSGGELFTAYFDRAVQRLARLSDSLVTAQQVRAWVLETYPALYRTIVADTVDATRTDGHPGSILVAVAPLGSSPSVLVSSGQKAAIATALEERVPLNVDVTVADPAFVAVEVSATIRARRGFSPSEVSTACDQAVRAYVSTDTWDWGTRLRRNEIVALLDGVAGVDWVSGVTLRIVSQHVGSTNRSGSPFAVVDRSTGDVVSSDPAVLFRSADPVFAVDA